MLWLSGLSPVENMEVMEDKEDWEDRENRENSKDTVVLQTPSCDEYKKGYADSEWLPCPPPPVLNKLLQRGEVHFRTPSGVDEKKLAIRFDISKNPKHRCIQQWDAARGRYVDLTPQTGACQYPQTPSLKP
ncbi:hypothetical protein BDZ89DRAFT_33630 [Hymenopellis radicata]|nr:hypothetical protein BDZ89DRAFT_33630 [Hymenopellis radicata]